MPTEALIRKDWPSQTRGTCSWPSVSRVRIFDSVPIGGCRDHHREFIAADPREQQRILICPAQSRRDIPQAFVAGRMAESVVDMLEAVDIDQQQRCQRRPRWLPLRAVPVARLEHAPIGQAGQRIAFGQPPHMFPQRLFRRDVLLHPEDPRRAPRVAFHPRGQAHPAFIAPCRPDPCVEGEAAAVADRVRTQPFHLATRRRLIEARDVVTIEGAIPRQFEQVVDAVGPGQRLVVEPALPDPDPRQGRGAVVQLLDVGDRGRLYRWSAQCPWRVRRRKSLPIWPS